MPQSNGGNVCIGSPTGNQDKQKDAYSDRGGTVKKTTYHNMLMATKDKRIKYLSYAYHGKCHDLNILRTEFDSERGLWSDSAGTANTQYMLTLVN